jgi:hypothetical protein
MKTKSRNDSNSSTVIRHDILSNFLLIVFLGLPLVLVIWFSSIWHIFSLHAQTTKPNDQWISNALSLILFYINKSISLVTFSVLNVFFKFRIVLLLFCFQFLWINNILTTSHSAGHNLSYEYWIEVCDLALES